MKNHIVYALASFMPLINLNASSTPSEVKTHLDHQETKASLINNFYLAYQNNDVAMFNEIMAANYTIDNAADIHQMSYTKYSEMSKNIKVRIKAMHKALPDFTLKVSEIFTDENKVFAKVIISGIQKGEFLGTAPTNKPIHIHIYTVFTVENNKIKHISEMWNELSIMRQLGCVML